MLTFLASPWIYLVGLSGFRSLKRGASEPMVLLGMLERTVFDLKDGPYDPIEV
jgi:hypothetical protein